MMEKIAILTSIMIIPCCATIYAFAETQEVAIGDSEAEVIEVLGKSQGKARSGDLDIMYYERGTVELKDGKVFNVKLVSEETAAERTAERLRQERARERTREAHRQELIEKGTAEKERMLADPAYAEMSAQELVN